MTRQAGVTLVEVLITLLILKLGLLGVLAAQLQALRLVSDATQHTTALALSRQIHLQLSPIYQSRMPQNLTIDQPVSALVCDAASPCTAVQFEQYLIARWQEQYLTASGTGLLYEPQFCLKRQQGMLNITASWQARTAPIAQMPQSCGWMNNRNGLALGQPG